jgi:FKBP-type peptidyl-prolyl cis-trans isomerase
MFRLSEADLRLVEQGLADGALGRGAEVPMETFGPRIDELLKARLAVVTEEEKRGGAAFLAEAAQRPGAIRTESGLVFQELQPGSGAAPAATDVVKIHYHGTFRDGRVFDSSVEAKQPATFQLDGVVPCFSQGVQQMKVGGKARLVCPPELAYGERGAPPGIPPGATLVFEVELLEIVPPPPQPASAAPGTADPTAPVTPPSVSPP